MIFKMTKKRKLKKDEVATMKALKANHCYLCDLKYGSKECLDKCGQLALQNRRADAAQFEKAPD